MDRFRSIFERARAGDPQALEVLLERHLDGLRAFVRLKCGPRVRERESCSDLVQSTCREVLEDIGGVECESDAAFRQWLYGVAYHKILHRAEHWRAQKRDAAREVAPGGAAAGDPRRILEAYSTFCTPSRLAIVDEELRRIEDAMDALHTEDRDIILEVRLMGRSHREVAQQLGKSEEAVRKMLSRARARLGLLLDQRA